jgi:multimeric flavodoxin WrbA
MYIIITASPNKDGLTAACGESARAGIEGAGGIAELFDISALKLEPCRICKDGWGTCYGAGNCVIDDCFAEIQAKIKESKGVFIITPVYWWQPSERMKYFCDRLRRCESFREGGSWAEGKRFNLIAAAGGSGNGTATCLAELEMWCRHIKAIPHERIGITRYNREEMLKVLENSGAQMVKGV